MKCPEYFLMGNVTDPSCAFIAHIFVEEQKPFVLFHFKKGELSFRTSLEVEENISQISKPLVPFLRKRDNERNRHMKKEKEEKKAKRKEKRKDKDRKECIRHWQ